MTEHSFTVTVAEGESGINIQVGGIQPFEGVDSNALEIAKALRLTMLQNTNRLAECIATARHQHIHPATKSVH
ncbi:hypothetical protein [Ectopseudomonas oleovorans]|uniref:Uncharacterized protein n=1 Tax=Ectopseudomonas oleovorans (strain CECT 5344) TaxID=1182590 RepID=W6R2D8_ECTO5|nr:hypothetical protein [Pseudomonas oleovorans]CDM42413.1 hypothetical protein BN5_3871 [Pseudomonas oleovorans CECT 5344]CDR93036.1 hypothetical protein PPSAL_3812 [Pseudomonas oleovorans]